MKIRLELLFQLLFIIASYLQVGYDDERNWHDKYVQPLIRMGILTLELPKAPVFARFEPGWND
ncbi:hypothetical protein [Sporomusa carbonis]|uniref:hypothetical protein n=1 Tax=Sporomusa carbonis TaxID=3076075 RepID=UPI003C7E64EC